MRGVDRPTAKAFDTDDHGCLNTGYGDDEEE